MNESSLRVEQIELVIQSTPRSSDSGSVGKHAERSRDLGKISSRYVGRGLVADSELSKFASVPQHDGEGCSNDLESGRTPIDKLDRSLGLDCRDGRVDILGDDISSIITRAVSASLAVQRGMKNEPVEKSASHVFSLSRIALDHLVVGLETAEGELRDRVGLVGRLGGGDDRSVGRQREVNSRETDHHVSSVAERCGQEEC